MRETKGWSEEKHREGKRKLEEVDEGEDWIWKRMNGQKMGEG